MTPKGSSAIKRCGLVGVGVVLLEEVCHLEAGFKLSYVQDMLRDTVHFLSPLDQGIRTLSSLCLHAALPSAIKIMD